MVPPQLKGDYDKSGGILSNIGIHFFDMTDIWRRYRRKKRI